MTYEEAIKLIKMVRDCGGYFNHFIDAFNLAIESIEKQMPKKVIFTDYAQPIYGNNGEWIDAVFMLRAKCPCCGTVIVDGELEVDDCLDIKYCEKCSQCFDWTEEEK